MRRGLSAALSGSPPSSATIPQKQQHQHQHQHQQKKAYRPAKRLSPANGARISGGRWLSASHYTEASRKFFKYNPQLWLSTLRCEVTEFMFWPWALITGFVFVLTFLVEVISPGLKPLLTMPMDAHVVLGGALSFLVVFRTNSAYDRWWEARNAWQTLISSCRAIGAQVAPALRDEKAHEAVCMQLVAFAVALKAWLREEPIQSEELGVSMDRHLIAELNRAHCPPLQAIRAISKTVRTNLKVDDPRTAHDEAELNTAVYNEALEQLRVLSVAVGACEKIKLTPMTFGYIATLRSFLILWLCTLPLSLIGEYGWIAVPALSLITFLFLTVEQMAIEIEQPFGDDANDLPLEDYILDLEATLLDMLPGRTPPTTGREGLHDGSSPRKAGSPGRHKPGSPQRVRAVEEHFKRVEYEYDDGGDENAMPQQLPLPSHQTSQPPPPPRLEDDRRPEDPFPRPSAGLQLQQWFPQQPVTTIGVAIPPPSASVRSGDDTVRRLAPNGSAVVLGERLGGHGQTVETPQDEQDQPRSLTGSSSSPKGSFRA